MQFDRARSTLVKAHANFPADAWLEKTRKRNKSIDGLPARTTTRYFGADDVAG